MAVNRQFGAWIKWGLLIAIVAAAVYYLTSSGEDELGENFPSGNGRIEATEINLASKFAGRLSEVLVQEGEYIKAGQALATLESSSMQAQLSEAKARHQEVLQSVATAEAQVALRQSELAAVEAGVKQSEAALGAARSRYNRTRMLSREGAASKQELDDDRAQLIHAESSVTAAKAQVVSAQAAIDAAKSELVTIDSRIEAALATIQRIESDIEDTTLLAPRDGRVQLRLAEPGEVVAAGTRVLNMVDLSDVSMTFFLPETVAGRIAIGSEARIVLDAAPQTPIPAIITFVADIAQFTPKTVETASERQKLMFRVKAQIPRELLLSYLDYVKTGLPGVAYVRLDQREDWPVHLQTRFTAEVGREQ
ncbi:MAG: HlyD family efflux transporter periplasmic adaptor subunit [Alcaligenaceae bacterium]|nr:HlyD family efflux transporter periplasmic adaptor subunit [Alcaligenaceae bacterium]